MPTTTKLDVFHINKLTQAQYDAAVLDGTIAESDISIITDANVSVEITNVLPTADYDHLNKLYQYIGTTNQNYTYGYFYKCVSDGAVTPTYSWQQVDVQPAVDPLPNQTGNSGKFLTTNGTTASWAIVDALPSQASQNGKLLTTNGTDASWASQSDLGLSGVTFRVWGVNE